MAARIGTRAADPRGIGRRAARDRRFQRVARDHRIEAVPDSLRIQPPRKPHRAQHVRGEGDLHAPELVLDEAVVEARVVRDEQVAFQARANFGGELRECGRSSHHRIRDPRERLDFLGNRAAGVHERGPLFGELALLHAHDPDLGDPIAGRRRPRGLEVDEGDRWREHAGF